MRAFLVLFVLVLGLLLVALALPSKHDTSVAAWWARVRYQAAFFFRAVLALACLAGIVRYVLLPLLNSPR